MSSTLINTLKMNLYSFLGSLTLLLFFANANANNCGQVYDPDQYTNFAKLCNCTDGKIVTCDDLSGLTPTNIEDIQIFFFNLKIFDGSFLANSAVTDLLLASNNLVPENITNLPSSVTWLGIVNDHLITFDGSFLANSAVTDIYLASNNLTTENSINLPSSVKYLSIINDQLTNFNGSFLANSAVTRLLLQSNNLVPENIINFPSSVTYLGIVNDHLTFDGSFLANLTVTTLYLDSNNLVLEHITNLPSSVRELGLYIWELNSLNLSFLANSKVNFLYFYGNNTDILPQNITNRPQNLTIKYGFLPEPEITPTTPTPTPPTTQTPPPTPTPPTTQTPPPTPTPTSNEKLSTALIIVIAISSFIFVAGGLYALYLKCNDKSGKYSVVLKA